MNDATQKLSALIELVDALNNTSQDIGPGFNLLSLRGKALVSKKALNQVYDFITYDVRKQVYDFITNECEETGD
jgi:hypothetical protein